MASLVTTTVAGSVTINANGMGMTFTTPSTGQNSWITWKDGTTAKWELTKHTSNNFLLYNYVTSAAALTFSPDSSNANFAGTLTATAGTFSGKLTAFLNTTSACLHTRGSNIFFDASSSGTNVNIVARAYDETYWGQMEFTASQGILYTRTTGSLILGANNAGAIYIVNGGKVGIGSTNPSTILSLGGSLATGGIYINSGADEDHTIIDMTGITGGGKLIWDDSEEAFSMSKDLTVSLSLTAGSTAVADHKGYFLADGSTDHQAGFIYRTATSNKEFILGAPWWSPYDDGSFHITLHWPGVSTTALMTIKQDGNVGINDSTPTHKLDVNGTFRVTGAATFDSSIGFTTVLAGNGSAGAPSFSFTSDTNTGMYRGGADILSFATAGVQRLFISASGALTVLGGNGAGYIAIKELGTLSGYFGSGNSLSTGGTAASTDLACRAVGKLAFLTNNSTTAKMTILADGNVGIGTTNPSQKLYVHGNIVVNAQILTPGGSNLALNPNTGLVTVGGALQTTSWLTVGGALTSVSLATSAATGVVATAADGGWNPAFHSKNTNADSAPSYLMLEKISASPANGDYVGGIVMRGRTSTGAVWSCVEQWGVATVVTNGSQSSRWNCGTWGAGTEYPNTLVANAGNVGIGTNAPANSATLDVRGRVSVRENAAGELQFGTAAAYTWMEAFDGSADRSPKLPIAINPWGGNVGIGTTNPGAYKLYVNGTFRTTGAATFDGTVAITGALSPLGSTNYNDNCKAKFGNGNDLQIYHDGSNSYITDSGTGSLRLGASHFHFMNAAHTEYMMTGTSNEGVQLYYNNAVKLGTTSTGVNITGNITTSTTLSTFADRIKIVTGSAQLNIGQWDTVNHRIEADANRPLMITSYQGNINLGTSGSTKLNVNTGGVAVTGELSVSSTVKAAGKLVVGSTATPTSKFQIHSTQSDTMTDAEAFLALYGNGGDGLLMGQSASSPYGAWIQAGYLPNIGTSHHYPLILQPHGSNVGIGTTAPSSPLTVRADTANGSYIAYFYNFGSQSGDHGPNFQIAGSSSTQYAFRVNTAANYPYGSNALVVKGDGKVGINTDTPGEILTLNSPSNTRILLQEANVDKGQIAAGGGGLYIQNLAGDVIFRNISDADTVRIKNDGKVGIGTASPAQKLHIFQTEGGVGVKHATIRLGGYLDKGAEIAAYRTASNSNNMGLKFSANNVTNGIVDVMTLDDTGRVGIGTDAPLYDLHVKMADGNTDLKLESDYAYGDVNLMLDAANTTRSAQVTFYSAGVQNGGVGYVGSDTIMKMWGDNNPADDHLCINSAGSVGIGCADPTSRLTVEKTSTATTLSKDGTVLMLRGANGANKYSHIGFTYDIAGDVQPSATIGIQLTSWTASTKSDLVFGTRDVTTDTAPTERMRITSAGKVGIGTTAPDYLLTLQNDDASIRLRSNTTTTKGVTLRYNHSGSFGELRCDQQGVNQLDMKYYSLSHKFGRNDSLQYLTISDTGLITAQTDQNNSTIFKVKNATASTSSDAQLRCESSSSLGLITAMPSSYSTSSAYVADSFLVLAASTCSAGLGLAAEGANPINLWTNNTKRMTISSAGYVSINTAGAASYTPLTIETLSTSAYTAGGVNGVGLMMRNRSSNVGTSSGIKWCAATSYHDLGGIHMVLTGNSSTNETADLTFWTSNSGDSGNAEHMRIKSDGNVGIGTTSPARKLDVVSGHIRLDAGYSLLWDNGHERIEAVNTGIIKFFTNNGQAMTLSGSNVGIGTTSPDTNLQIVDSTINSKDLLHLKTSGDSVGDYVGIKFTNGVGGAGPHAAIRVYGGPSANDAYISLLTTTDGGTLVQGLTQDYRGYVGIGTNAPDRLLHLYGGASGQATPVSSAQLVLEDNASSNYITFLNPNTGSAGIMWGDPQDSARAQLIYDHSAGAMTFNAGGGEHVRIKSDGNVGIGTTNPSQLLDVNGTTRLRGALYDKNNSYGTSGQVLSTTGSGGVDWITVSSGSGDITGVTAGTTLSGGGTSGSVTINHANHTGEVTGSGSLTIAGNVVDEANLKVSNAPTNGYVLTARSGNTGGMTWEAASGGGGGMTDWKAVDGDGSSVTISNGKYLKFKEGTGIDVNLTDTSPGTVGDPYDMTIKVVSSVLMSIQDTNYNYCTPSSNTAGFYQGGSITVVASGSGVTFSDSTSSDYRLKSNISTFNSEAWTKVKSVNLRRFDFNESLIDPNSSAIIDRVGFIAHELAEAGIEGAVEGTKDEVDSDGNPVYQKVCLVKLVPVMWGALKEATARIETLETKVQALENS